MGFFWSDKIDEIDTIYAEDINMIGRQVANLSNAAKPMIVVTAEQIGGDFIIDAPWFNNTVLNNGDMFFVKPRASDQIKVYSHAYIKFADKGEYARPYQITTPMAKAEFLPDFFNHDIPFVVIYETNAENDPAYGGFIVIDKYMTPAVADASNDDSSLAGEETTMLYSGEVPELPLQSQTGVTLEKDNVLYMWNGWTWRSLGGTSGAMVFKDVVDELPDTANEGEVYKLHKIDAEPIIRAFDTWGVMRIYNDRIDFGGDATDVYEDIANRINNAGGTPLKFQIEIFDRGLMLYIDATKAENGVIYGTTTATETVEANGMIQIAQRTEISKTVVYHNGEWIEISESGVTKSEMESYIAETLLGGEW